MTLGKPRIDEIICPGGRISFHMQLAVPHMKLI